MTASGDLAPKAAAPGRLQSLLPPLHWLPGYRLNALPHDLVAGVTLAAYAIPVSLAYASLAGVPPHYGLYCYLFGGLAYALFGSSRQLAIGPTSAISMLIGTTVAGMAGGDVQHWADIAGLTALVLAGISILAWLLRLSAVVAFISETVLTGFKAGAALTIATTQLPKLFGVPGGGEHFAARVWALVQQIPDTNLVVLGFGLAAIALLVAGERLLPGRPVALVVVVLAIVIVSVTPLTELGIKTVGVLPQGLPPLHRPPLKAADVDGVIPLAFACFLLAYIEGVSAARTLARQHDYAIDPRQELLALGAANLAAAFGHGYPVAGGLSQSMVNDKGGARTPLALVFASATLALCLLFLTGLLQNLPTVVLAAVVLVAVKGLINISEMRHLWRVSRFEFAVAMTALAGVLVFGILRGVVLAALITMLMVIIRAARPHVAVLGRIPGTRRYSDLERNPDNEAVPGVLIVRVEASVLYFNVDHVRQEILARVRAASGPLLGIVWDLSSTPYVDVSGARMMAEVQEELAGREGTLRLVDARARVRDLLRAEGLEKQVGPIERSTSVDDAVAEMLASRPR